MKNDSSKLKIIFFAVIFFGVLGLAKISWAASFYYVDNSVAANGNGSQTSPWKNLSDIDWGIIEGASKPSTIYISGGATSQTYAENFGIWASGGGIGKEIIIKRPTSAEWPGHSGVVKIPSPSDNTDIGGQRYIIIDGIDFTNHFGGLWIHGSSYITIRNCIIKNVGGGKSIGGDDSDYVTIQNCILGPNNTAAGGDDPIQMNGNNWVLEYSIIEGGAPPGGGDQHFDDIQIIGETLNFTIRYNIFRMANSAGIAIYAHDQANLQNQSLYVYGNIFEMTNTWGDTANGPAISASGAAYYGSWVKLYLYNNTFINWSYQYLISLGVSFGGDMPGNQLVMKNNIFYNSIVNVDPDGALVATSDYNIFWMTYNGVLLYWNDITYTNSQFSAYRSATGQDAHSLYTNPLLTSVNGTPNPNHDLRPTASSPGIDTGVNLGSLYNAGLSMNNTKSNWPLSVTTVSRPQGSAWDIGAYEYVSTVPPDTIPPSAPSGVAVN